MAKKSRSSSARKRKTRVSFACNERKGISLIKTHRCYCPYCDGRGGRRRGKRSSSHLDKPSTSSILARLKHMLGDPSTSRSLGFWSFVRHEMSCVWRTCRRGCVEGILGLGLYFSNRLYDVSETSSLPPSTVLGILTIGTRSM